MEGTSAAARADADIDSDIEERAEEEVDEACVDGLAADEEAADDDDDDEDGSRAEDDGRRRWREEEKLLADVQRLRAGGVLLLRGMQRRCDRRLSRAYLRYSERARLLMPGCSHHRIRPYYLINFSYIYETSLCARSPSQPRIRLGHVKKILSKNLSKTCRTFL